MFTDPDGTLKWWQKLLIGVAFIVVGAIATAVTGGSFLGALACGLTVAAKAAAVGAVTGLVTGGISAAINGGNILQGMLQGAFNGAVDGFMWGGISAGLTNVIKPGTLCFAAGTKVLAESGQKNIEDVKVGDRVLSYNEQTGKQEYKRVLRLFRNETKEWCHVFVDGEEIVSTPGHKYYLPENTYNRERNEKLEHLSYAGLTEKWVSAKNLKAGDKVLFSDGRYGVVEKVEIEKLESSETTYNFEVEDFHTYYVGAGVLVHNLNCHTERGLARQKQAKMTNTKTITSNGNTRIPDYLNVKSGVMGEAKSVGKLSYTRQLRDMFEYASKNGMKMFLKVEKWTQMSKPLQAAIKTFNVFVNVF